MKRIRSIFQFYYEGFSNMTTGRRLWVIILLKLAVIFLVFKLLFFPGFLEMKFKSNPERGNYVINELTKIKK